MSHDEQLAWEARAGKPVAVASFFAALMAIVSGVYLQVALSENPDGADEALRAADREGSDFIVSGVLQAVAILLLIPVLLYLYRATRYRRGQVMQAAAVLVVLGGLTLAVVGIFQKLEFVDIGHGFFPEKAAAATAAGKDVQDAAEDYISDEVSPALQGIALAGSIALAFAMVMISLNAMRAGLLSRFMGILGIFVGILLVIPLGVQILQLFWFSALGLLFLDRWPGGRGPAWQTGEAIPWPGAAEQREEMERRRAEREGLLDPPAEAEEAPDSPRPSSRKRRKKQR
jgi:hypothetical protein